MKRYLDMSKKKKKVQQRHNKRNFVVNIFRNETKGGI